MTERRRCTGAAAGGFPGRIDVCPLLRVPMTAQERLLRLRRVDMRRNGHPSLSGQDRASAAQASINPQRSFAPAVTGVTKMDRGRMAGARSYGFDGRTQEYRYHDG